MCTEGGRSLGMLLCLELGGWQGAIVLVLGGGGGGGGGWIEVSVWSREVWEFYHFQS